MCNPNFKVSVLMTSYNHQEFIEEALDSVVCQKTSFPFEVLVYDDKSTDRSRDIILRYKEKYPEMIKTIFPDENQFSKGKSSMCDFLIPAASGKYIAELECDDCWTDELKLQKQFNYMEAHHEVSLCAHSVELFNNQKKRVVGISNPYKVPTEISTSQIVERGGAILGTCSYFCRTDDMRKYVAWRPKDCPVGDWPMMIYLSLKGKVCCLPYVMGRYRVAVPTSWTGQRSSDNKSAAATDEQMISMVYALIEKMPESYRLPLISKAAVYLYDLSFRTNESIGALVERVSFPLDSLTMAERVSLSLRLRVKRTLSKAGLLPVVERVMLRLASR